MLNPTSAMFMEYALIYYRKHYEGDQTSTGQIASSATCGGTLQWSAKENGESGQQAVGTAPLFLFASSCGRGSLVHK